MMGVALLTAFFPKLVAAQPIQDTGVQVIGTKVNNPGGTKAPKLDELWSSVEAHYRGISVKTAAIEAATLDQAAVKATALPNINAQVQHTYGSFEKANGGFFPLPGLFNVNGVDQVDGGPSAAAATYGSTTLSWEVFAFGKHRMENRAAGSLVSKARQEKEVYLLELKKSLADRYITLLYGNAKLDLANHNMARLNAVRLVTAGLAKAGIRPAADSLLAYAAYIQAMADGDKWQGAQKAAYIHLLELFTDTDTNGPKVFSNASGDGSGEVDDISNENRRTIDSDVGIDVSSDVNSNVGVLDRLINDGAVASRFLINGADSMTGQEIQSLNALRPTVNANHPALASLQSAASYYKERASAVQRTPLPSLNLLGGIAYRSSAVGADGVASGKWKDGFLNPTHNLLGGIGITWDITSLRISKIKAAALSKTAEKTYNSQLQYQAQMQATLEGLVASLAQDEMQLKKTRQAVTASRNAYTMYLARYKSGIIGLTELLQIQQLLDQAELHHIEAARSFWLQHSKLAAISMDFSFLFNHL